MSKTEIDLRFTFSVFSSESDKANELYTDIEKMIDEKFDKPGDPELLGSYVSKKSIEEE